MANQLKVSALDTTNSEIVVEKKRGRKFLKHYFITRTSPRK